MSKKETNVFFEPKSHLWLGENKTVLKTQKQMSSSSKLLYGQSTNPINELIKLNTNRNKNNSIHWKYHVMQNIPNMQQQKSNNRKTDITTSRQTYYVNINCTHIQIKMDIDNNYKTNEKLDRNNQQCTVQCITHEKRSTVRITFWIELLLHLQLL